MSDYKSSNSWNINTVKFRIKNSHNRSFYEAGSPNHQELEVYRYLLKKGLQDESDPTEKTVLVLGMTPGLRCLCHQIGYKVVSIDQNPDMINFLKNWVPQESLEKETIYQGNWMELPKILSKPVHAIIGDGVFGNILSIQNHVNLLSNFKKCLAKTGIIVLRKILFPRNFDLEEHQAEKILDDFRQGLLTEAEFGFEMRIWGSSKFYFDSNTFMLNNQKVFQRYQKMLEKDIFTPEEHEIIKRYYFNRENFIISQDVWESLLTEVGFSFETRVLQGKKWYEYYPIYYCNLFKNFD